MKVHMAGCYVCNLFEEFTLKHNLMCYSFIPTALWINIDTSKIEQQKVKFFYF